ncbi:T9SS type A sorting domain-containing protein [Sabulilitoribacter multivorans]|uniref:T9SS type A sorting domain-containing protein n=1 Tax=Flaviramulus multivorans TaxID=1304750 RepID=A0ABS9IK32_9FLAO|nr:LamG-like jellyroll fold domain-containing protein [Flaviramulus multivorans]MCF7560959.1 T9SS type A sorting domain-containing protein [Flaviramulus multivorans]
MRRLLPLNLLRKFVFFLFVLCSYVGSAQIIQVEIVGGAVVTQGSTVVINAGSSLDFRITNTEPGSCSNSNRLRIEDVNISNIIDFDISPNNPSRNIRQASCNGNGSKELDFEIENISATCITASTLVTIEIRNQVDFTFTLQVNSSPEIFVLGGTPYADIYHGDTVTSDTNGTYFGVVEESGSVTRTYVISNIGSCNLDITSLTSDNSDFAITSPFPIPWNNMLPYDAIVFDVTFTAPVAGTGTQTAIISIGNTDNTTFTFTVSAEMFDFNIPGPGGITADFRLWLKSTRGITQSVTKVSTWADLGTNGKDAIQPVAANQPTYLDNATDNINFNPVIKFENDGAGVEQYLYNPVNGFYSQDIFIVMIPDATMTSTSPRNTIFAGITVGTVGDITGVGFGDYSSEFTNETLSYNQDIAGGGNYNGVAELNSTYSNAGIINIRNNSVALLTGQEILYNSNLLTTSEVNDSPYTNVTSVDPGPPPTVLGTRYWVGRNYDLQGSLNGRVAEIFTFAERVPDADRQKIESYLGIKYGITLGASTEAQKDYINSFNTSVWDISANAGYNYHVAGIGRDSISDLNQKQSKTINLLNEVTIGLGGVFNTNNANSNEFKKDGDFLVWGNDDGAFSGTNTNTVTVASGVTTSLTRIDRKWMIVESNEDVNGDVGTVYVSIPSAAFSSFSKTATEEYALIISDTPNFADGDIIDVIPLRSEDGGINLQTWYDFEGTKYFTFGKTPKLTENHAINIASGDYMVGEFSLNLNTDNFTISAWIKCPTGSSVRTVMAKGEKLQIRLNTSGNIEVYIDDSVTPKFTSNMDVDDGKWHHTTFVYDSGTILMYIDGVLDKSVQNIVHPSPNFNNYAIGALYIDKNNIINPLLGEIDEVYVWDVELSQDQVRYLMNQEIERFDIVGTDYTTGKIIPQASASNEVAAIPWSNLRVYYDFNSIYGSTIEGLTDDRFFLRLKYLDKDKSILDDQTAPLPYISANDGDWDTAVTWSNNADQVIPNSLSLDGTTMVDWNIVQISHNIDSGDRDISLLGLIQTDGILKISDPVDAQDETNSGQGLSISHYLELDGIIDLVGESQLVQSEGSVIDIDSGGFIERDQQGTANGYNYNYWSSSVGPIAGNTATRGTGVSTTNANHTIAGVLKDGTISGLYQDMLFNSSPDGSGTPPPPGFARTISTEWLYKFYGGANNYNAWVKIDESSSLLAGEGFTMKGTGGTASIPISTQQNYVFIGLPNNGDITLPLDNSSNEVDRLVGNPYPSAIDASEFILDNMSIADGGNNTTGTVFNGALYFWDHFGQENSHTLKDYVGGYATRNLTGGAAAISNDSRINSTSNAGGPATGTKVPGPYIPVNQGFFVSTALDGFNNDNGTPILTVDGGDIVFKNSQRVFEREDGSNSLFLKSSSNKKGKNVAAKNDVTPTIKLVYSSPKGYHRQIVLGANHNASIAFDMGYDAFMVDVNEEDMYWIINQSKFVIQGVGSFVTSEEFPIGVKVKEAGISSIKIDALENIDNNFPIFIKDESTGETHQINNDSFDIFLEPGEYLDRFKLVFEQNNASLSIDELDNIANSVLVYYDSESTELKIVNKQGVYLSKIEVYNILGQSIITEELNSSNNESISLKAETGAYIIKLNSEKGAINKKIIMD